MILRKLDGITGVAWLSSARAVGCSLQWGNERNPRRMLNFHTGLSGFVLEEVGTMSSQHGPYILGDTHATMALNNGLPSRKAELIPSNSVSVGIGG